MENETGIIFFWLGTSLMLLLGFAIVFLAVLYQKKVYKMKKQELENLSQSKLKAEIDERVRIGADLHDGISSDITALRNYVSLLKNETQDTTNQKKLNDVMSGLTGVLKNVQEISHNLIPPLMEEQGLSSTLEVYFEKFRKWHNVTLSTKYTNKNIPLSAENVYEFYRIVQELCTNMVKHGNVNHIHIVIAYENEVLTILLSDDGIPFDFYKTYKTTKGLGIPNIVLRLYKTGATLTQLPVEKGNKIEVTFKVPPFNHLNV